MQHVPKKWLILCMAGLASIDIAFIGLFLLKDAFALPAHIQSRWGISAIVAIAASVHLIYLAFIYPFILKRITWVANVTSFAIMAIVFSVLIDASGNTNLTYRLGYAGLVFLMGMAGNFAPMAAVILTWLILALTVTGSAGKSSASLGFNIVIDIVVTAAALAGWLIFKRFYINTKSVAEVQLTNMLKEEQFKSNIVIESITDGVMIVNAKGTVQLINKSAANILGWSQTEAIKLDYRTLIKPTDDQLDQKKLKTAIELSMESGKSAQQITKLETRNNHRLYVDIVASPIFGSTETVKGQVERVIVGTIAVLRDVDTQKREEQQRSDFISTASHEMRTPVASIQGFIELALNPKVATIDEKARNYLEKAHDATKHLGQLFQDLLTVSKSDDGRLTNKPVLIEIGEFLKEIADQERISAEKKGLQLVLQQSEARQLKNIRPLMYAQADPERLREVIFNVIENAIKYTSDGIITVGASINDQSVIIRVSDTGMGIAQEDIPHLFQKFYRTDNTATREIGGTGLGLYICKQIMEMMNGRIWVESSIGVGSTFYIEMPRVAAEAMLQAKNDATPQVNTDTSQT